MRRSVFSAIWLSTIAVTASVIGDNAHDPAKNTCVGYNEPQCTPTYCTTDGPDCYTPTSITVSVTAHTSTEVFTPWTTITSTSGESTAPGNYPATAESVTPRPPPPTHSTRTADTATPTPSTAADSSAQSSAPCTHWHPPPPALTAYSDSDYGTTSSPIESSSCITLSWTGSTHSDFSTSITSGASTSHMGQSSSTTLGSETTFSSTTTSDVGYAEPTSTTSTIQGTNFTGQGVRDQVVSTIAVLVAAAMLPFLVL